MTTPSGISPSPATERVIIAVQNEISTDALRRLSRTFGPHQTPPRLSEVMEPALKIANFWIDKATAYAANAINNVARIFSRDLPSISAMATSASGAATYLGATAIAPGVIAATGIVIFQTKTGVVPTEKTTPY